MSTINCASPESGATNDKVVYVLGAGFSMPAGAPSQKKILEAICNLGDSALQPAKDRLLKFLTEDLQLSREAIPEAALEDIYTPIDRCIADGTSLKSNSAAQLQGIRADLESLISSAIESSTTNADESNRSYVQDFAKYLVRKAGTRADLAKDAKDAAKAKAYDPLSIISLNWDCLLDNALHQAIRDRDPGPVGDYDAFGSVDYCCYISSLDRDDPRIRSGLWSLGCRGYNVKLLKLHGSMNWLQCPNCQRLFVAFGPDDPVRASVTNPCRHCDKYGNQNPLCRSLVMPTFLKDLTNFQLKLVWQNAGVELMEAKRLVFIGYSLPLADFEFRQLLSRMVRPNACVRVIHREPLDDQEEEKKAQQVAKDVEDRYRQLFGMRQLTFDRIGAKAYVKEICSEQSQ